MVLLLAPEALFSTAEAPALWAMEYRRKGLALDQARAAPRDRRVTRSQVFAGAAPESARLRRARNFAVRPLAGVLVAQTGQEALPQDLHPAPTVTIQLPTVLRHGRVERDSVILDASFAMRSEPQVAAPYSSYVQRTEATIPFISYMRWTFPAACVMEIRFSRPRRR